MVSIKPVITFDDVNEIVVSMLRDTRMSMKKGKDMLSRYEIPEGAEYAIGVTNRREDFIRALSDLLTILRAAEGE